MRSSSMVAIAVEAEVVDGRTSMSKTASAKGAKEDAGHSTMTGHRRLTKSAFSKSASMAEAVGSEAGGFDGGK